MSTQGTPAVAALVDAYTLALASVVLTAGSVADRLGRKRVFTFGVVLFTVASAACAFCSRTGWSVSRSKTRPVPPPAIPSGPAVARCRPSGCKARA